MVASLLVALSSLARLRAADRIRLCFCNGLFLETGNVSWFDWFGALAFGIQIDSDVGVSLPTSNLSS